MADLENDGMTLMAASVPEGCSANVDRDGDGLGDGDATAGTIYNASDDFFVTCDLCVTDAETTLSFEIVHEHEEEA